MTASIIRHTVTDDAGRAVARRRVTIELSTGSLDADTVTDRLGYWQRRLPANTGGAYYAVTEPNGATWTISVPSDGGTYDVEQLVVTAPGSPAAAIGAVRYDTAQPLTTAQVAQAAANLGLDHYRRGSLLDGYGYGHSFSTDPGQACTSGREWFEHAKLWLRLGGFTTYAQSGSRTLDSTAWAIGSAGFATWGVANAVAGAQWTSAKKGLVVLASNFNDISHAVGGVPTAITGTKYLDGLARSLRAFLAKVSAGTIVESGAMSTPTPGAWGAINDSFWHGGNYHYTTTPGAYRETTVTVGASGRVHLLGLQGRDDIFDCPAMEVKIDGVVYETIPAADFDFEVNGSTNGCHAAYTFETTPGSHTFRFTHAGGGTNMYVDALLVEADEPPPVLVYQDSQPVVGTYTAPQVAIHNSNRLLVDPVKQAVCADFANATWVPCGITTDGHFGDGVHPNDRGMRQMALDLYAAAVAWLDTHDPDALYVTL